VEVKQARANLINHDDPIPAIRVQQVGQGLYIRPVADSYPAAKRHSQRESFKISFRLAGEDGHTIPGPVVLMINILGDSRYIAR